MLGFAEMHVVVITSCLRLISQLFVSSCHVPLVGRPGLCLMWFVHFMVPVRCPTGDWLTLPRSPKYKQSSFRHFPALLLMPIWKKNKLLQLLIHSWIFPFSSLAPSKHEETLRTVHVCELRVMSYWQERAKQVWFLGGLANDAFSGRTSQIMSSNSLSKYSSFRGSATAP